MPDGREQLAKGLSDLTRLLVSQETLASLLGRVASLAVYALPGCDGVGVTLVEADRMVTAAYSDDTAAEVDSIQYEIDDGPCPTAIRAQSVQYLPSTADDTRWADVSRRAQAAGIHSVLALPLVVGEAAIGALNLYSDRPHGFGEEDHELAPVLADQAAIILANASAYAKTGKLREELQDAVELPAVINQAAGILMERHHCSAEEAVRLLSTRAEREGKTLEATAQAVVGSTPSE